MQFLARTRSSSDARPRRRLCSDTVAAAGVRIVVGDTDGIVRVGTPLGRRPRGCPNADFCLLAKRLNQRTRQGFIYA